MNESKISLTERLRQEGRWVEASKFKDEALSKFRAEGMKRGVANVAAWEAMEKKYPPSASVDAIADPGVTGVSVNTRVKGLGEIPEHWPALPPNASLASEIQWVQASRIDVVEELANGSVVVHLDRADRPAPSKAAIDPS